VVAAGPGACPDGGGGHAGRDLPLRAVAGHAGGHAGQRRAGAPRRPGARLQAMEALAAVDTVVFDKTGT
jgi:hypothetical protein